MKYILLLKEKEDLEDPSTGKSWKKQTIKLKSTTSHTDSGTE